MLTEGNTQRWHWGTSLTGRWSPLPEPHLPPSQLLSVHLSVFFCSHLISFHLLTNLSRCPPGAYIYISLRMQAPPVSAYTSCVFLHIPESLSSFPVSHKRPYLLSSVTPIFSPSAPFNRSLHLLLITPHPSLHCFLPLVPVCLKSCCHPSLFPLWQVIIFLPDWNKMVLSSMPPPLPPLRHYFFISASMSL